MRRYHPLSVLNVSEETADSVRIELGVPDNVRDEFAFQAGQHLPLKVDIGGQSVRRTYSIVSKPGQMPLELGIRVQPGGQFSEYAKASLKAGDTIEAMPPFGRFHTVQDSNNGKNYLAFAAGSGITPVLSMMRDILDREPGSRIALFFGNRRQRTTMFIDDLYALKNRFPERVQLYFVFSQEAQEFELFSGRLDKARSKKLIETFCGGFSADEALICGPDSMIDDVRDALLECGLCREAIRTERYGAPRRSAAVRGATDSKHATTIDIVMDGHRKSFDMPADADNIVDAAAAEGIELPFSCKGGVCATCRTHVRDGEVRMATNYGLEPWEVEAGFVLACQSVPTTPAVTLDYDKT